MFFQFGVWFGVFLWRRVFGVLFGFSVWLVLFFNPDLVYLLEVCTIPAGLATFQYCLCRTPDVNIVFSICNIYFKA